MACNYMATLVEEIALEGLDGITLQSLWVRLESRKDKPMLVDDPMKEFLWRQIRRLSVVQFFLLPIPRPNMHLPKLDQGLCQDQDGKEAEEILQVIMQHMSVLYPFAMVEQDGVKGSCSTFHTRGELDSLELINLSLEECNERFGNTLVIVANQNLRNSALFGSNPVWLEISTQQYCVLECIGRGRHFGMYSYGPSSLQELLKADPRSMFYIRNKLLLKGIVTKQMHILRATNTMCRSYLLMLSRFHTIYKSNMTVRQEKILHTLLLAPNSQMAYTDLREVVGMDPLPFKKMTHVMQTNGVIEFKPNVPYRQVYPNALEKHCVTKAGSEKLLRIIILKRDTLEEVKPDGEDDSDDEDKEFPGLLDQTNQTLDRTLLYQAYQATEIAGEEGLTQRQLGLMLGLSKLDSRAVCKQLTKEGFVSLQMIDQGKQRITKYTAIRLQRKDYKLALEKEKFIALTGSALLLDNLMYSGNRAPQNFVLKDLTDSALDISVGDDVQVSEMEIDVRNPLDLIDTPEDENAITYRTLKRVNLVLSLLFKHKVISDFVMLQKLICEEETREGYQYKIDRKSLFRLIAKMRKAKCINLYKAVINSDSAPKSLTFVCHMDVDSNNSLIQSEIEQAKLRFSVKEKEKESNEPVDNMSFSVSQLHQLARPDALSENLEVDTNNTYGHCSRFVRIRLMHQFIFYLVWDYSGSVNLDQSIARTQLLRQRVSVPDDCPQIFRSSKLDYRTFVPPLPVHEDWSKGWALLADIVRRVPLVLFTRLVRLRYIVPGLSEYLSDPVRRNYMLGQLPGQMRANILGNSRKYVFSIFEAVQKLCYVGLVQFGPQRLKEKDQLFVYVNRKGVILDTTATPPRYFQIDSNLSYPRHLHILNSLADVEAYWADLHTICMSTKLGQKADDVGQEITLESIDTKHVLVEACSVRQANEAEKLDVGYLPGDQLGAGGLDSALFSHLRRNWNGKNIPRDLRLIVMNQPKPKRLPPRPKKAVQRVEVRPSTSTRRAKARITKRVLKKRIQKKKVQVEEQIKFRFRVSWGRDEDRLLCLCKAASIFLTIEDANNKLPVQPAVIVNILKRHAHRATLKNGAQCLRRMKSLYTKNESFRARVALYLEAAHQCPNINAIFSKLLKRLRALKLPAEQYDKMLESKFEALVLMLQEKQEQLAIVDRTFDTLLLPDSLDEFHYHYHVMSILDPVEDRKKYPQPSYDDDIRHCTLLSLLFSSIGLYLEREKYSSQLLHVFQQYTDQCLHRAVDWARKVGVVVIKNRKDKSAAQRSLLIPLVASPYHFSVSFYYLLQSKVPFEVFQEAQSLLKPFQTDPTVTIKMPKVSGGSVAVLMEGLATGILSAGVDISSQNLRVEFEPDINPSERQLLSKAFKVIAECQKKLDSYQESEADVVIPSKRMKVPCTVITRADFSDEEDEDADEALQIQVDERNLSNKERVVKENVEARLAFYSKREELQEARSVNEKRDRRARLTIEPAAIVCTKVCELPLREEDKRQLIEELTNGAVIPKHCPSLMEVLQSYNELHAAEPDILNATKIIQLISNAKELGLSIHQLKEQFDTGSGVITLRNHLTLLSSIGVILRTGVNAATYVHSSFSSPWLLDSEKFPGGKSKEAVPVVVSVRPWIRVDGSLNRRALDRYLGAVLNFLLCTPGCTLVAIQNRFLPAMQPFHVQELVEMLCTLGCLSSTVVREIGTNDIFADPPLIEFGLADFTELEDSIVLEPTVDAIIRLSQFIGKKEYGSNFLEELKTAWNLDT
ncbi:general transcription factor 3C polypeptide 1 [Neocloeon triangulifer]|uniref:general transcription factor 3C polypeptide 1 n=1 Tax=Neocloeon triangulifer TaxID=2078957 RepID=UPI00286F414A|nr:general transcription factor 3C polypeptide 1 [Neocloeon triangulifer]